MVATQTYSPSLISLKHNWVWYLGSRDYGRRSIGEREIIITDSEVEHAIRTCSSIHRRLATRSSTKYELIVAGLVHAAASKSSTTDTSSSAVVLILIPLYKHFKLKLSVLCFNKMYLHSALNSTVVLQ